MIELQKTYGKTIHTWVSCPLDGVDITLTECTCAGIRQAPRPTAGTAPPHDGIHGSHNLTYSRNTLTQMSIGGRPGRRCVGEGPRRAPRRVDHREARAARGLPPRIRIRRSRRCVAADRRGDRARARHAPCEEVVYRSHVVETKIQKERGTKCGAHVTRKPSQSFSSSSPSDPSFSHRLSPAWRTTRSLLRSPRAWNANAERMRAGPARRPLRPAQVLRDQCAPRPPV
jgi:hypothetical protein